MRTMNACLCFVALLGGCGDSGPSGAVDMAMSTPAADLSMSSNLNAKAICDQSCAALTNCGVFESNSCSSDCQGGGSTFIACLNAANGNCNAMANCILTAGCGGVGASGTATCNTTSQCEGSCNVNNPTPACICGCVAAMSPTVAINLLINNTCAPALCPSCQPATFNGAACNTCFAQMCASQHQQCVSH